MNSGDGGFSDRLANMPRFGDEQELKRVASRRDERISADDRDVVFIALLNRSRLLANASLQLFVGAHRACVPYGEAGEARITG